MVNIWQGGVDSGALDLSTGDHLIHDYNQIKSYKGYYSRVSSNTMCSIYRREGLTPHQGPHCTDEVYDPRLHIDVLLSSVPHLVVPLCVRLIVSSGGGLCLSRAPADCKKWRVMRQVTGYLRRT